MDALKWQRWHSFFTELVMRRCVAAAVYGALSGRERVDARVECDADRAHPPGSRWLRQGFAVGAHLLAPIRRVGSDIRLAHVLSLIAPTTMLSDEAPTPAPHGARPGGMTPREGARVAEDAEDA